MERTLVLVKADGVERRLIGQVISRFERSGLKIVGLKFVKPSIETMTNSYPSSDEWFRKVGERSIKTFDSMGLDAKKKFGTDDSIAIGKQIKSWIVRFMTSGKVVAMVLEGNRAVDHVRRLVGETDPLNATPGTIRGDFSIDNVVQGNMSNRPIVNLVHASGSIEEAPNEIKVWFEKDEIFEYQRDYEDVFYREW